MALRMPDEFNHHTDELSNVTLHYLREGSGPPLLLVHGWPGFCWEWRENIGPLAEHFDVIAPDMRGFGDSTKPPLDRVDLYSMERVVEDFVALIDRLGLETIYLCGHDFGAAIVHKFVRRHRDRVRAAAILNPAVPGGEERYFKLAEESWYFMFHQLDLAVDLVGSSREACRSYFRHWLTHWSADPNTISDAELEIYVDTYMKPGNLRGGFNFYRATPFWTVLDSTISACPMVFLQGMNDPVSPVAGTELIPRWYTDFTIEYVDGAGHFLMCEKPEVVNDRLIKGFLGGDQQNA